MLQCLEEERYLEASTVAQEADEVLESDAKRREDDASQREQLRLMMRQDTDNRISGIQARQSFVGTCGKKM